MMERAIGEVFEFDAIKLKVKKEYALCDKCYFENILCISFKDYIGECSRYKRKDDKSVIFVKIVD